MCVFRAWVEYKHGFGDVFSPNGEFWLGNDPLHFVTSQGLSKTCYVFVSEIDLHYIL